jgi:hypothetical protein
VTYCHFWSQVFNSERCSTLLIVGGVPAEEIKKRFSEDVTGKIIRNAMVELG